ncbi:MAG: hypothetical protein ABI878_06050 [Acidobacteriota bacterium]
MLVSLYPFRQRLQYFFPISSSSVISLFSLFGKAKAQGWIVPGESHKCSFLTIEDALKAFGKFSLVERLRISLGDEVNSLIPFLKDLKGCPKIAPALGFGLLAIHRGRIGKTGGFEPPAFHLGVKCQHLVIVG